MKINKFSHIFLYLFTSLIVLIIVLLATIILLLRSPLGNTWITKTIQTSLYQKGITLHVDNIELTFPNSLTVKNLSLDDEKGPWLHVDYASILVNPWSAFKGILTITSLDVTKLTLTRLPSAPIDETGSQRQFILPSIPSNILPWWLSFLKIQQINITDTYLGPEIINVPLKFSLVGTTSLTGWQGQLSISSTSFSKITGNINIITDQSLLKDYQIPWKAAVQMESTQAIAFSPDLLNQPLTTNILLYPKNNALILEKLSIQSKPWNLAINKLSLTPKHIHGEMNITHTGTVASKLPIESANLSIKLSGNLKKPVCNINLTIKNKQQILQTILVSKLHLQKTQSQISSTGEIIFTDMNIQNTPITSTVQIDALLTPKIFSIQDASCKGPLINIDFSSNINTIGSIIAELTATAPNVNTIAALFALKNPPSGQATFHLKINRSKEKEAITGTADIHLKNMDWGTQILQGLLSSEVTLTNDINYIQEPSQYIQLKNIILNSKNIHGNGDVALKEDQLNTDITLTIANLESTKLPITGTVDLLLKAQGTLLVPDVTLIISSPKITYSNLIFDNPNLHVKTTNVHSSKSQGTINLTTEQTSPYTLQLSTNWVCSPNQITLKNISGTILGAVLKGEVIVKHPENLSQGTITCTIHDWKELSYASNTNISGNASIKTVLDSQNNQSISTELKLDSFSIGDSFSLKTLTSNFIVKELTLTPQITFLAHIGPGKYTDIPWNKGSLEIIGTSEQLNFNTKILGDSIVNINLDFNTKKQDIYLQTFQVKIPSKNQDIILNKPVHITFSQEHFIIENLALALKPSGSINANISISQQNLNILATLNNISLSILNPILNIPLEGYIYDSTINISGKTLHPKGILKIHGANLKVANTHSLPIAFTITGNVIDTPNTALKLDTIITHNQKSLPATIIANIPIVFTENNIPIISKKNPITAKIHWKGTIEEIWSFVPIADTNITGQASLLASLEGTLEKPRYQLQVTTTNATYTNLTQGIYLENITSNINIDPSAESRITLTTSKNNKIQTTITGTIGSEKKDFPIAIDGTFTNFTPLQRKDLDITLSGKAQISGTIEKSLITGDITVNQGKLDLLTIPGGDIPTLNVIDIHQKEKMSSPKIQYLPNINLHIHIPNRFFVRGTNLESEWSGTITLKNNLSNPQVTGKLTSLRGIFTLLGRNFAFTNSSIIFTGSIPPIPTLDISLMYKSTALTAVANITGLATKPKFILSSTPPLPQDEIVAQVLFGKNTQNLSKVQLVQLATELTQLAGFNSGASNIFDQARKIAGVDVLRINSVQKNNNLNDQTKEIPVIEIGKRLTDSVYLGLEQSLDSDSSGARIEIELNPNLMLEGRTGLQNNEIGINWKKDY